MRSYKPIPISTILLISILLYSCGGGGGTYYFDEISVYEYNIQDSRQRVIKKIGVNEMGSHLIRYFNNSKKIIYSGTRSFVIIDESGKEEIINMDSIYINDNYFTISPNDKYILFGGKVIIRNANLETITKVEGLYLYDIGKKTFRLIVKDSHVQYPVFSNSGDLISYKVWFHPNSNSALFICDINEETVQKISSNDFNAGYFSHFTDDDQNVVFVERDKILSYHIDTHATDTLIENINFGISSLFSNKVINIYKSKLYYLSQDDNPIKDWLRWNISSFDIDTRQNLVLSSGISPMAVTEDYLLIRESRVMEIEPSKLKLIDKKGGLIFDLEIGYSGDISYDNSSIVYIHSKEWKEQF